MKEFNEVNRGVSPGYLSWVPACPGLSLVNSLRVSHCYKYFPNISTNLHKQPLIDAMINRYYAT